MINLKHLVAPIGMFLTLFSSESFADPAPGPDRPIAFGCAASGQTGTDMSPVSYWSYDTQGTGNNCPDFTVSGPLKKFETFVKTADPIVPHTSCIVSSSESVTCIGSPTSTEKDFLSYQWTVSGDVQFSVDPVNPNVIVVKCLRRKGISVVTFGVSSSANSTVTKENRSISCSGAL